MSQVDEFALWQPCEYCGAQGWCVTKSGHPTQFLHAVRTEAVRQAYASGYWAGLQDERRWGKWRAQQKQDTHGG